MSHEAVNANTAAAAAAGGGGDYNNAASSSSSSSAAVAATTSAAEGTTSSSQQQQQQQNFSSSSDHQSKQQQQQQRNQQGQQQEEEHHEVKRVGNYEIGRLIGTGPSSSVRLAMDVTTKQPVAIKIVDKENALLIPNLIHDQFKKDVFSVKLLRHKNLVTLKEVLSTKRNIYLVSELVTGGELFDLILPPSVRTNATGAAVGGFVASGGHEYVNTNDPFSIPHFPEDQARKIFQQLVVTIRFCHHRGIAHKNLKPEQLLVDSEGNLKITDLATSNLHIKYAESVEADGVRAVVGNPHFAAPEIVLQKGYSANVSDVWSCGALLYLMLSGHHAFDFDPDDLDDEEADEENEKKKKKQQQQQQQQEEKEKGNNNSQQQKQSSNDNSSSKKNSSVKTKMMLLASQALAARQRRRMKQLFKKIEQGKYHMSPLFSETAKDLIKRMLVCEPARRIGLNEICNHPWFVVGLDPLLLEQGQALTAAQLAAQEKASLALAGVNVNSSSSSGGILGTATGGISDNNNNNAEKRDLAAEFLAKGEDAFVISRKLMLASLVSSPRVEVIAAQAAQAARALEAGGGGGDETQKRGGGGESFSPTAALRYVLLRIPFDEAFHIVSNTISQLMPHFQKPTLPPGADFLTPREIRGFAQAKNGLLTFLITICPTVVPTLSTAEIKKGRGDFFDFMDFVSAINTALGPHRVASQEIVIKKDWKPTLTAAQEKEIELEKKEEERKAAAAAAAAAAGGGGGGGGDGGVEGNYKVEGEEGKNNNDEASAKTTTRRKKPAHVTINVEDFEMI